MERHIDYEKNEIEQEKPKKKRRFFLWFLIMAVVLFGLIGAIFFKASFTFSQMNDYGNNGGMILPVSEDAVKTEKESDRLNILLLGLRGAEDSNGGLLTDTIIVLSIKKSNGKVAMISIPRDLYVKMPILPNQKTQALKEKINFAYALGEGKRQGAGLVYSKVAVENVTGLFIDYVVSVDFQAFQEIVDILGGVDIYLEKPFSETTQFSKEILLELPAGRNHLDGEKALFFVRSRYSTNDFDRARRQQQVLMAMKEKAMSLGILLSPIKIFELLNSFGRHVRADMGFSEINNLIILANDLNSKSIIHKVFDTSPEGLLYNTVSDKGAYILLPVGDNFDKIREACKNILNQQEG
jgi:LCP family protein required for cell wall assembly